jgi:hypothetical protein
MLSTLYNNYIYFTLNFSTPNAVKSRRHKQADCKHMLLQRDPPTAEVKLAAIRELGAIIRRNFVIAEYSLYFLLVCGLQNNIIN